MSKRPPINFYDLPDKKRKEIVKGAMEEAEKLQAKLVKKYERRYKINKHFNKKRNRKAVINKYG